ncbi:MAG: hypothetical protein K1X47_15345 [Cyclobacteriaceae bacterium]|nr:hypothetical protein [Cyclobacteriaceae bacterium]
MKNSIFAITLLALVGLVALESCKKSETSAKDKAADLLTASAWKVQSVTIDANDQTSKFSGLSLTFSKSGSFTSVNGAIVWPASGTWNFSDAEATHILRDDGVEVTVQQLTSTTLITSLTWSKSTYQQGRVTSVSGKHVFTFSH